MARKRIRYTEELKRDAVRLIPAAGVDWCGSDGVRSEMGVALLKMSFPVVITLALVGSLLAVRSNKSKRDAALKESHGSYRHGKAVVAPYF